KRDPLAYQARVLQSLDPAPARRGREADAIGDLGDRQSRVLLQDVEDAGVDRIKFVSQRRFSKRGFHAIKYPKSAFGKGIFRKANRDAPCYALYIEETRSDQPDGTHDEEYAHAVVARARAFGSARRCP